LTDIPSEKITELVNPEKTHPKKAKVLLGKTVVSQFYGEQAAEAAAIEFDKVFAKNSFLKIFRFLSCLLRQSLSSNCW